MDSAIILGVLSSPPGWAGRRPNPDERRLLGTLYQAFVEHARWPLYEYVEGVLDHNYSLDLEAILVDIPVGLLWPDPAAAQQVLDQSELAATLYGLTYVEEADRDVELFVRIFGWAARERRDFVPPANQPQPLTVPIARIATLLSRGGDAVTVEDVVRVLRLGANEHPTVALRGSPETVESLHVDIHRPLRSFADVENVDDYFDRKPPPFRAPLAARASTESALPTHEGRPETDTPPIISDRPLSDPAADQFGYAHLARHLATSLAMHPTGDNLVIAINGAWGLGKSTLLNFIAYEFSQQESDIRPYIVRFNPWWFSGSQDLTARFFSALETTLQRARSLKARRAALKLRAFFGRLEKIPIPYGDYLSAAARLVIPGEKTLDESKAEVEKTLSALSRRVVVLIDDVDRLTAEEIRQMFRLLKAVADFPNTAYVIAFDRDVVVAALQEAQGIPGSAYLEKIVQLPLELPLPEDRLLRLALEAELVKLTGLPVAAISGNYFIGAWMSGLRAFFKTPRDVVRISNALRVTYPPVAGEVNVVDFLAMETLRLWAPSAWNQIRQTPEAFVGPRPYAWTSQSNEGRDKAFHAGWLDALRESEAVRRESIAGLLVHLFPRLSGVIDDRGSFTGYDEAAFAARTGRVCSPAAVSTYFRLAVPQGGIGRIEMREVIESARDPRLYRDRLIQLASEPVPTGGTRVAVFLDQLLEYGGDTDVQPLLETLIEVPLTSAGEIVAATGGWGDHDHIIFGRVVTFLAPRLDTTVAFALFTRIVEEADALFVPVAEIDTLLEDKDDDPRFRSQVTPEQAQALRDLVLRRIRREATDGRLLGEPRLAGILYRWNDWASSEAAEWLRAQVREPLALATILNEFATVVRSGGVGDWIPRVYRRVDPSAFDPFIDMKQMRALVESLPSNLPLTDAQREAVDLYKRGIEAIEAGRDPI